MSTEINFHQLALNGKLNTIDQKLLTADNLLVRNNEGRTPLHGAAQSGHFDQIPVPLLTAENLLVKDSYGDTPLHEAAWRGHLDQVPVPLLTAENLLVKDNYARTPLHRAAQTGHLDQIPVSLLTAEDLRVKDNNGCTPLHRAAQYGYLDQVPVSLLTAENLLVKNSYGQTPLHLAAYSGHLNQIPITILTTENLLVKNNNGWTPLHYAAENDHLDQIQISILTTKNLLVKDNDGQTPLYWAACNGHLDQIPISILTVENLLVKNNNEYTPLHEAAEYGHLDQIPVPLLTAENLLVKDNNGWTPLHGAALYGHLDQIPTFGFPHDLIGKTGQHFRDLCHSSPGIIPLIAKLNEKKGWEIQPQILPLLEQQIAPKIILTSLLPHPNQKENENRWNHYLKATANIQNHTLTPILHKMWLDVNIGEKFNPKNLEQTKRVLETEPLPKLPKDNDALKEWVLNIHFFGSEKAKEDLKELSKDWTHVQDWLTATRFALTPTTPIREINNELRGWEIMGMMGDGEEWVKRNPDKLELTFSQIRKLAGNKFTENENHPISIRQNSLIFTRLDKPTDFIKEKEEMKHCILGYVTAALQGSCTIYHVTKKGLTEPATLEISPQGEIRQIKGILNAKISFSKEIETVWNNKDKNKTEELEKLIHGIAKGEAIGKYGSTLTQNNDIHPDVIKSLENNGVDNKRLLKIYKTATAYRDIKNKSSNLEPGCQLTKE